MLELSIYTSLNATWLFCCGCGVIWHARVREGKSEPYHDYVGFNIPLRHPSRSKTTEGKNADSKHPCKYFPPGIKSLSV